MRNIKIIEVENGWKIYILSRETATYNLGLIVDRTEEYVFNDWSEMMEFIEDYFADEEE